MFKAPINLDLLNRGSDSDDDEERARAAKRQKAAAAVAAGGAGRPGLSTFLPPPKHLVLPGPGAGAGGSGVRRRPVGGSGASKEDASGGTGGDAGAEQPSGNEAFRVHASAPVATAADTYAVGAAPAAYAHYAQQPGPSYPAPQQRQRQQRAAADEGDPLAAALQKEALRAARGSGAAAPARAAHAQPQDDPAALLASLTGDAAGAGRGIVFKEVDGAALKHMDPAQREANEGMRQALGSDYAQQLRGQAAPFKGNKMANRKHQIGAWCLCL